ncbi:MAG: D-alanyl-D-alanine carboxypeptidase family protein [Bacillota bacterium]
MMKSTLKLRPLVYFLPLLIILSSLFPAIRIAHALEMGFKAKAAVLLDFNSAEIIYSLNEHEKLFPASTTKIMTLLLALEALQRGEITLQDEVPITQNAASMGGSQLFLSQGDVVDMESLLIGITVGSGNDAAVAVAEYIAGSEGAFVELMNRRAAELKMMNTNFVNPTGLHGAKQYSTAYDLALLGRELLEHDIFFHWSTIWMDENFLEGRIRSGKVYLSNTNRMVRSYRGCDGVKTGYTRDAGHCTVATAKRNDTRFIAVVLGAPDSDTRYFEAGSLLDYGFANFKSVSLKDENEIIITMPVEKGSLTEVNVLTAEKVSFLLKKGEEADCTSEVILPRFLYAPLKKGEKVGEIVVSRGDAILKTVDLVVDRDVENASFPLLLRRYINSWLTFGRKKYK